MSNRTISTSSSAAVRFQNLFCLSSVGESRPLSSAFFLLALKSLPRLFELLLSALFLLLVEFMLLTVPGFTALVAVGFLRCGGSSDACIPTRSTPRWRARSSCWISLKTVSTGVSLRRSGTSSAMPRRRATRRTCAPHRRVSKSATTRARKHARAGLCVASKLDLCMCTISNTLICERLVYIYTDLGQRTSPLRPNFSNLDAYSSNLGRILAICVPHTEMEVR